MLELVRKLGLLAGTLSPEAVQNVQVVVSGELSAENTDILGLAALRGLFSASSDEPVTFVNAPKLAEQRGVTVEVEKVSEATTHRSAVEVRAVSPDGHVTSVAGALTGLQQVEKIVNINSRSFDLRAEGHNLIVHYQDRPGVLGTLGTVLGNASIDIQPRHSARTRRPRRHRDPACRPRRRRRRGRTDHRGTRRSRRPGRPVLILRFSIIRWPRPSARSRPPSHRK